MEYNFTGNEYLEIGKKMYAIRGIKAAIPYLDRCLQLDAKNSEAWLYKGYCFNYEYRIDEAIECYTRAINSEPENSEAFFARAGRYLDQENYESAVRDFFSAVEIYGYNYHYYLWLAYSLLKAKSFEKCIDICNEIMDSGNSPRDRDAFFYKYSSLLGLKRYEEAIQLSEKQVRYSPQDAVYHNNLGYAFLSKGDYVDSVKHFDMALNYEVDDAYALNNKGWALFKIGHYEKAFELFCRSVQSDMSNSTVYLNLAHYYLQVGNREQAKLNLLKACELMHSKYHNAEADELLMHEFGITPN
ncbi:MAG: hypothetical protein RLZZ367_572 [Bacteroidota bacterium]|jgi:tetratricopeptide (TPR) repeat protein